MYKLIKRIGNQRISFATFGAYQLNYNPNWVTKPNVGKIFIYDNLTHFRISELIQENIEVWRVECGKIQKPPKEIPLFMYQFPKFWSGNKMGAYQLTPSGTLFTDWVRLVELVE